MKIIDKYIYKEMILPIVFGISLFSFILLIDVLSEMMESLLVKKIPLWDIIEMVSYQLPPVFVITIPMGVLLGVMIAYGTLSNNTEIIAMESIGLGMRRFLIPAFVVGLGFSSLMFLLEEKIVPDSAANLEKITKKIAYTKPSLKIDEKIFIENIGDYSIYVNKMNNEANEAENLILFRKNPDLTYPEIIMARKTVWKNNNMIMEDADFYRIDNEGKKDLSGSFDRRIIPINTFLNLKSLKNKKRKELMGISEIKKEIAWRKEKDLVTINYEVEYHQKIALPVLTIILSFLGVMLSVKNSRSGKGVSFGVSLVIIFVYFMAINFGKTMARKGVVTPMVAIWTPGLVLLMFSLILFVMQMRRR